MMLRAKRSCVHCGVMLSAPRRFRGPVGGSSSLGLAPVAQCGFASFFSGSRLEMMTAAGEIDQQVHAAVADPALREALAAGDIGVWSLNLSTGAFTADEAARALWGLGDEDRIASSRLPPSIEPADADEVAAFVAAARAGEPASHLVFRIRCADGEPRWTQVRSRAAETPDGRLLIGVALDVTERMRAESALSATEARLRRAQELGG